MPALALPRGAGSVRAPSQNTRHRRFTTTPKRASVSCLASFLFRMAEVMRAGAGVKPVEGAAEGFHTRQKSKFLLSFLEGLS